MQQRYRVIVIGGGHAGVEAAWAAANLLAEPRSVALVTLDPSKIGVMSCNPAIGGLAKGQMVREIDALGGLMGLATDATGIQFKVLNTSKGPAVRGPRAQCDKHAYAEAVQRMIASRPEIDVIAGAVEELLLDAGAIRGVRIKKAQSSKHQISSGDAPGLDLSFELSSPSVVLTTGTFMRGLMHTGETRTPGGRFGEAPAIGISAALRDLGFELGRLKTGTPPRLRRSTIDWDALELAGGDADPVPFSDLTDSHAPDPHGAATPIPTEPRPSGSRVGGVPRRATDAHRDTTGETHPLDAGSPLPGSLTVAAPWMHGPTPSLARFPVLPQIDCRLTATTAATHDAIRANLHRAPMYSGQIESIGPRYCPSIEDKVVRFADKTSHHVYLEPESLRPGHDEWVYCNGISTSLPADVQDAIVRSLPGCERAEILRYGYAVEYDMVRPHQIAATGMTKLVHGLFLAGQINGTSGYEEAAAQGIVAGINAARLALGHSPITIGRDRAYLGVLMDDLVTKTPTEPYRMFTSRAEHRLMLRADNAADRLTPLATELGLLGSTDLGRARTRFFAERRLLLDEIEGRLRTVRIDTVPLGDACRRPEFTPADLHRALGLPTTDRAVRDAVLTAHTDRFYESYITRQLAQVRRQDEVERRRIPATFDYAAVASIRSEARQALTRFRPETLGQAGRLEGITPADLTLLAILIAR